MAGVIARAAFAVSKRPQLLVTAVRGKQKMMPDSLEHATGLERKEMEALARGNSDPFNIQTIKRGPSTKDNPTLVPSFYNERMIGCICHEDAFYISYMWLYKGEQRRCECGNWFKLTEAKDPFDFSK